MRLQTWAASGWLLLALAVRAEDPSPSDAPAQELPGVTVEGKRNPLEEADRKLRQLKEGLPCNGCDAKPVRPGGKLRRIVGAVSDYAAGQILPTAVPDDSRARSEDPDPVRNAEEADKSRPRVLSSPNNNP